MQRLFSSVAAIVVLCLVAPFASAQKGTLTGRVSDAQTGEPLPAANVLVKGTYYGAATDLRGNFTIPNVSPGIYTVEVTILGYTQVQQTGVKVAAGQTVTLNFKLQPTVLALGQEVVVVGKKPLFNIEETSSRRALSGEELANQVVYDVRDVVATQVGVVRTDNEIHIRGGRSYENAYLIDGVSVQDPLSGTGFGLRLSTEAIQEVEVITGGFNAEYGQAMSGVVSVTTREGGERYHGLLSYKRDHLPFDGTAVPVFGTLSDRSRFSFNTDNVEANLSGPEPLTSYVLPALGVKLPGRFTFFGNASVFLTDDFTKRRARQLYSSIFHGASFAPRENNEWSGLYKLTWKIDPTHKLAVTVGGSVNINQNTQSLQTNLEYVPPGPGYPYEFQYNLDNFNTFTHLNNQVSLAWTHTLSPKTFYELRLSRYFAQLRSDVNGKHWTQYTEPKDIVTQPIQYFFSADSSVISVFPGDGFFDYGDGFTWHDHYVQDYTLKADLTSHFSPRHKMKAGLEMTIREMQLLDIYAPWFGGLGLNNDIYRVYPNLGAMYLQDNLTFKGLIANLGVRLDWWFPGKYVEDAVRNPEIITLSEETRRRFWEDTYSFFGRRWKGRISPRLGISHPITDNQMLFFSYGHFSKWPKPQFVYAKLGPTSAKSTFQKFGNPNLNPETTVAYELGLKHKFTEDDVLSLTAYYKDIFDYVTTVSFRGAGRLAGRSFITYLNLDYSRARGIEVEYRKRAGEYLTGTMSASYSIATGKSSTPDDALLVARGELEEKPITENFLIWDRPWQVNAIVNLYVAKGKGPRIFGVQFPEEWNLNVRFFTEAGKRYTPMRRIGTLPNGRPEYLTEIDNPFAKVGSSWKWVDVNFEKYFRFGGLEATLSLEVLNLFSWRNANIINPVTGRAYEFGDPTPNSWNDPLYPDTQAPLDPYPFNPARYLSARNMRVGLKVKF